MSTRNLPIRARVSVIQSLTLATCLVSLGLIASCGGASDPSVQGIPKNHRPAAMACPEQRGAGTTVANPQSYNECAQDSNCTTGIDGRCLGFKGTSSCSYDTCFSDSDCPDNQPCECRPSAADTAANYCVTTGGNCRVDSDCGPDGFCSPSLVGTGCGWDQSVSGDGYFCRTPQDSCLNDSDCDTSSTCAFDIGSNHWTCILCSIGY